MQHSSIGISASVAAVAIAACAWFSGGQAAGAWEPSGLLSEVRSGATATRLDDGRVLIAGGANQDSVLRSAELVLPSGAIRVITSLHTPRTGHTATRLPDGRVLVAGGTTLRRVPLSSAEIFDPVTSAWTLVEMRAARTQHTATLVDGEVVLAGGLRDGVPLDEIEVFDAHAGTFARFSAPLAIARLGHSAVSLSRHEVLVAGGSDGMQPLSSTELIDLGTGQVTPGPTMQVARTNFTATALATGDVLIAGGSNGVSDLVQAERLVASAGRFVPAGDLWGARQGHRAVALPHNNGVLLVGGTIEGQAQPITELYVPGTATFKHMGVTYGPHIDGAVDTTGVDGIVLAAGGVGTAGTETFRFTTLRPDKAAYRAGELVTMVGGGWMPGEPVTVTMTVEGTPVAWPASVTAVDEFGYLVVRAPAPPQADLPGRWVVTARAASTEAQAVVSGLPQVLSGPISVVSRAVR